MNSDTALAAIVCTLFITIGGCEMHSNYLNKQPEIEAIKAGLIQKIDPQTKTPIWTKP